MISTATALALTLDTIIIIRSSTHTQKAYGSRAKHSSEPAVGCLWHLSLVQANPPGARPQEECLGLTERGCRTQSSTITPQNILQQCLFKIHPLTDTEAKAHKHTTYTRTLIEGVVVAFRLGT